MGTERIVNIATPEKKKNKKSEALEFDRVLIVKFKDFHSYPDGEKFAVYTKMKKELGG